jgi:membrane fusion protein (multidrug efflux system)
MRLRNSARIAIATAGLALVGCDLAAPGAEPRPVHVEVVTAEPSVPALLVPAVVEAKASRLLGFRFAGRVAAVHVSEGDRVAAGDPIASYDLAALERHVAAASAAVERAERRVAEDRLRTGRRQQLIALASDGPAPEADAGVAGAVSEAELRYGRVALADAQARLAAGVLRAPVAGIVGRPYLGVGDDADAGAPVVRLFELESLTLRAAVPRVLLPLVREGGEARVRLPGPGGRERAGRIVAVVDASSEDPVPFEVRPSAPDPAFVPGAVVEVAVGVSQREAEFSIPLTAVRRGIDDRPFAFVVVPAGRRLRIARRWITLGGLRGERAAVVAGLEVGDRVVSFGQEYVTVGDVVRVVGEGP